jgi:hypothetical protein
VASLLLIMDTERAAFILTNPSRECHLGIRVYYTVLYCQLYCHMYCMVLPAAYWGVRTCST